MENVISGKGFVYGANIDTDQIYPGRFLDLTDPDKVAEHAMEGADPSFVKEVKPGKVTNETTGATAQARPLSGYVMEILASGGIKPMIKEKYGQ